LTDKPRWKHNLLGGGDYWLSVIFLVT